MYLISLKFYSKMSVKLDSKVDKAQIRFKISLKSFENFIFHLFKQSNIKIH